MSKPTAMKPAISASATASRFASAFARNAVRVPAVVVLAAH
jgi:hypothetical protein